MDLLKIISNYLLLALGLLAFLAVWVSSVLTVSAGVARRSLPREDQLFWLALAIALPLVGFAVYLLAGLARRIVNSEPLPDSFSRSDPTSVHMPPGLASLPPEPARAPPTYPAVQAGASPAPARCYLTGVEGPAAGAQFALVQFPVRIGRGEEAQVRLETDLHVSRRHAEIYQQGAEIYIRDLGSMHGTAVNGETISSRSLRSGDRITVGDSVLQFLCR